MTKLFVGGIPYSLTNQKLEEMFAKFGTVASAKIIIDIYSGNSKGFAFVEMQEESGAQKAIKELDGFAVEGRKIGVSVARPKESFGGGGRQGGFDRSNQNNNNSFLKRSNRR